MPWQTEGARIYRQMLLDARAQGATLSRQSVVRLLAAFQRAIRDLDALDTSQSPITQARAKQLRAEIKGVVDRLEGTAARISSESATLTVDRVVALHQEAIAALETVSGVEGIAAQFGTTSVRAVAGLVARASKPSIFRTLIKHHVAEAQPELNRMIESAVARGVSPDRLTKDVARLLSGNDIDYARYGSSPGALSGTRTIFTDARMIAVSETNNALRESNATLLATSRTIHAAKWQVSGAHPKEDECDVLAQSDFYGLGPGMYDVGAWPTSPHPHCACTQGGPIIFRPRSEWNRPRTVSDLVDDPTIYSPDGLTPKGTARAIGTVREIVAAARAQPIGG